MKAHDKTLAIVLVAALFSLATLQGLNYLVSSSDKQVLGETTTAGKANYYSCTKNSDCASGNCSIKSGTSGVCIPNPNQNTPTPTSKVSVPIPSPFPVTTANTIPCTAIKELETRYCTATSFTPTPTIKLATPTTTKIVLPTSVKLTPTVAKKITLPTSSVR